MNSISRFSASRVLAVAAVLSTVSIVWFGWWMLAVSVGTGVAAVRLGSDRRHHRGRGAIRELRESIERRLNPHSWRPRG